MQFSTVQDEYVGYKPNCISDAEIYCFVRNNSMISRAIVQ